MPVSDITADLDVPLDTHTLKDYVAVEKPDGSHEEIISEPVKIPVGATFVDIIIIRDTVPDTKTLVVKGRCELSIDGGATWSTKPNGEKAWPFGIFPLGFTAAGGADIKPGAALISGVYDVPMPDPSNAGRMIRTTLIPIQDIKVAMKIVCRDK